VLFCGRFLSVGRSKVAELRLPNEAMLPLPALLAPRIPDRDLVEVAEVGLDLSGPLERG
jgi:hypothetical protein